MCNGIRTVDDAIICDVHKISYQVLLKWKNWDFKLLLYDENNIQPPGQWMESNDPLEGFYAQHKSFSDVDAGGEYTCMWFQTGAVYISSTAKPYN